MNYELRITNYELSNLIKVFRHLFLYNYKLTTDNVIKFYDKQLPRFKQLFQEFKDYTINGGMAAFCFDKYAKEYTHQKGLLLFTQSDDKIKKLSPDNMLLSEF